LNLENDALMRQLVCRDKFCLLRNSDILHHSQSPVRKLVAIHQQIAGSKASTELVEHTATSLTVRMGEAVKAVDDVENPNLENNALMQQLVCGNKFYLL
jgi:hypothetical protein